MTTTPAEAGPVWHPIGAMMAVLDTPNEAGRKLALQVVGNGDGRWTAIAIEVADGVISPEDILASHAHKLIGNKYTSPVGAIGAAEEYGRAWAAADGPGVRRCECPEIVPPPPPRRA